MNRLRPVNKNKNRKKYPEADKRKITGLITKVNTGKDQPAREINVKIPAGKTSEHSEATASQEAPDRDENTPVLARQSSNQW